MLIVPLIVVGLAITAMGVAGASFSPLGDGDVSLTYETFRSPAVSLRSGQIANTAGDFGPLPMPKGKVAVRFFNSTVVDATGRVVPETELYVHHYIMFSNPDPAKNPGPTHSGGFCSNLANVWGIGAELRGVTYRYPKGYAIVLDGEEVFGANLHFIRTTNVPTSMLQDCIECRCVDSDPPLHPKGQVSCCPDATQCYGMGNSTLHDAKDYYLQYTVGYEPVTEQHQELTVFSLDVTSTHTSDCQIQYNVPALKDGEIHTLQTNVTVAANWSVVFMELHQHIGGVNMTVEHFRSQQPVGPSPVVCSAAPMYDRLGYLVDIPTCRWEHGYSVRAGDTLRLTSHYSNRGLVSGSSPWHGGVMGLVYLAAVASETPKQQCLEKLHYDCGPPPYTTKQACLGCAEHVHADLAAHHCSEQIVAAECAKTHGGGNVVVPDTLDRMTFSFVQKTRVGVFTVTSPEGNWFGVGYNADLPEMNGTGAFVYSTGTGGKGKPALSYWILGPHTPGALKYDDMPVTSVTTTGGLTTVVWETSTADLGLALAGDSGSPSPALTAQPASCWLFAQGTGMAFAYHGSTRGATCQN